MKAFIKEKVIGTQNCKVQKDEVREISYLIDELEDKFIGIIRQTQSESESIHTRMQDAQRKGDLHKWKYYGDQRNHGGDRGKCRCADGQHPND